jgi:hypothetical protein
MIRTTVAVMTAVVSLLASSLVRADARVTVHDFYGPNASRVRDDVVNLLERQSGVTIISKGQIENTAEKLGVDPYSPEGRIAVGKALQLSAWMTGVVKKRGGKLKLTVAVFDGANHTLVARTRLSATTRSRLGQAIDRALWRKSRYAIMRAAMPSEAAKVEDSTTEAAASPPEPVPAASDAADEVDEGEDVASRTRPGESLRAFLGLGSPYRNLAYSTPITSSLGDYQLSGAPMLDLNVVYFPARAFTRGFASWLGLEARGQITLAAPTVDRDGNQFKSRYDSYHFGLRARVPVAAHYISGFAGYAMNRFAVTSDDADASAPTPSVDYRMVRMGAGTELALSDTLLLGLDGAWLHFLEVGDIGKWFPRATGAGLELAASATYSLTQGVFARAGVSYQRAFFDFNPRPGDRYAAGGATDQYLSVSVGAGIQL